MQLRSFRDPRRHQDSPAARVFQQAELESLLGTHLDKLNRLSEQFKACEHALTHQITPVTRNLREAQNQLNRIVTEFNCTVGPDKKRLFSTFRSHVRNAQRISSRLTKHLRPLALLSCQISNVLEETRMALGQPEAGL